MSESQLIEALKTSNRAAIEELIASGTDINQQDEQGWTPLNWASGKGDLAIVRLFIENGADVTKVGRDLRTPYMIALAAGHAEVVKLLREAEEKVGFSSRRERQYCKAYYLRDLRRFSGWTESKINWQEKQDKSDEDGTDSDERGFVDDDIVFIHQDFTVTQSMWHNENVIFNQVTPAWEEFCAITLKFKVPDDLDLMVSVQSAEAGESAQAAVEDWQDDDKIDLPAPFEGV
jgi:hypothetical protein